MWREDDGRIKPNGLKINGRQSLLQGMYVEGERHIEKLKKRKYHDIIREEFSVSGVHHESPVRLYGDAMREWRRGAAGNVKEEDCEGGKAGEEGPVMGGVAVR